MGFAAGLWDVGRCQWMGERSAALLMKCLEGTCCCHCAGEVHSAWVRPATCSPGTMRMRDGLQGGDSPSSAGVFAGRRGPQHLAEPCEGSPVSSGTATTISSAVFPQQPGWHQVAPLGLAAPVSMCRRLSRPCPPVPSGESCGRATGPMVLGSRDAVSTQGADPTSLPSTPWRSPWAHSPVV